MASVCIDAFKFPQAGIKVSKSQLKSRLEDPPELVPVWEEKPHIIRYHPAAIQSGHAPKNICFFVIEFPTLPTNHLLFYINTC